MNRGRCRQDQVILRGGGYERLWGGGTVGREGSGWRRSPRAGGLRHVPGTPGGRGTGGPAWGGDGGTGVFGALMEGTFSDRGGFAVERAFVS